MGLHMPMGLSEIPDGLPQCPRPAKRSHPACRAKESLGRATASRADGQSSSDCSRGAGAAELHRQTWDREGRTGWRFLPPGCALGWQEGLGVLPSKAKGARPRAGPEALHPMCLAPRAA